MGDAPLLEVFITCCGVRRIVIKSMKGRMADALAHGGDEGRDKLR